MWEQVAGKLAEYGLLGLVIAVQLYALGKLFLRYDAVQEGRSSDNEKTRDAINAAAHATNNLAARLESLERVLEARREK